MSGPTKACCAITLGLIVPAPSPQIALRIGDEVRGWTEGGSLVFDDTHTHEAWNDSTATRVVLFVDFVRPMPVAPQAVNLAMLQLSKQIHPAVAEVRRNTEAYMDLVLRGDRPAELGRIGARLARALDTEL